ncbi:MAG: glycosyltransferase family 2 protein [candidate division WOR-3 bacterium]|nr:glycosyltransferase family 2 protein [candidate division WOR-3 bacterium]MCX7947387.1 glycosyltransferase family 2 protein [candidate division WOR-3 bacterium]MDW8150057.1 glycosyltransferase family 2 protein [candidate division WOR-3 bacterium]
MHRAQNLENSLSIILVNYYTSDLIRKIIEKLKNENIDVVVWNNSSLEKLDYENIKVINSNINIGFGPAVNRAIKYTRNEFVLILNPDCNFELDAIYKMYEYLKNNEDVFAVSPKILTSSNKVWPSARKLSNPFLLFFGRRSVLRFFNLSNEFLYLNRNEKVIEVEALVGTFLMFRKSVFLELGGFDERFFFYAEDLDLSIRARKRGYKLILLNDIFVFHSVGITRKIKNYFAEYKRAKSLIFFLIKNYPIFKFLSIFLLPILSIYLIFLLLREILGIYISDPFWK